MYTEFHFHEMPTQFEDACPDNSTVSIKSGDTDSLLVELKSFISDRPIGLCRVGRATLFIYLYFFFFGGGGGGKRRST